MGLRFSVHNSKILFGEISFICILSPEQIAIQFLHIKSITTLLTNKTNHNRTELASLFRSPQAGLGLEIAVIYKIYGIKKYYFGKTRQGAKKVSFTACHSGKL